MVGAYLDGTVRKLKPRHGKNEIIYEHTGPVDHLAVSPDGSCLVVGCRDGTIKVLVNEENPSAYLQPELKVIAGLALDQTGQLLVTAGFVNNKWTIRGWQTDSVKLLFEHQEEFKANRIICLALSPSGDEIAVGRIKFWNLAVGKFYSTKSSEVADKEIQSLAYSSNGRLLAAGTASGNVYVCNSERLLLINPVVCYTDPVISLAFSPDNKVQASSSDCTIGLTSIT